MAELDSLQLAGQNAVGTIYEHDFYSGSQITVMLGDVFVDNAVSIAFSVQQTRSPVYGFASQYYSFVSDGHVIVQGDLVIAFKEAGYLLAPIQRFLQLQNPTENRAFGSSTSPRYSKEVYTGKNKTFKELADDAQYLKNVRNVVERSRQWKQANTDNPAYARTYDFYNELGHLSDTKFENWAETFEDALWFGSDTANPFTREKLMSKNVTTIGQVLDDETILNHRRADQYLPIDIWITYGDMNNQSTNHTVKKLMDVQFIGQSQTIQISGEPCFESYSFIARNLV